MNIFKNELEILPSSMTEWKDSPLGKYVTKKYGVKDSDVLDFILNAGETQRAKLIDEWIRENTRSCDPSLLNNALWRSVGNAELDITSELIKNGANVNFKDEHGNTPLGFAVVKSSPVVVRKLLEMGADVNARNEHEQSALMIAASNGNIEVMKALVENGADVNAQTKRRSVLTYAVTGPDGVGAAGVLISKGVDINALCDGNTSLIWAAIKGLTPVAKFLLKHGARPDIKGQDGTASKLAGVMKHPDLEKILKRAEEKGPDIDAGEDEAGAKKWWQFWR